MTLQQRADEIIHRAMKRAAEEPLVVICAWCPDAPAKNEAAFREGKRVSHTICPSCLLKFEESK